MSDLRDFSGALDGHISGSGSREYRIVVVCSCGHAQSVGMISEYGASYARDESEIKCSECGKQLEPWGNR